ncbi:adenosylcobinamide kinase /adenosylcobinamide-phosphate guanylyltransferase [Desulfocicer vacuolatum DSM 3385]|uniref:Adenosylcobinamide kinase n=1 Tax=Desulfocicer vacuolatum DSM 3385 TaxID=1121400 RepID=A0A1W2CB92_9BACT|nr:bifunctional adenosylcobinamide kinase/adenosylcobinamide-phosphate guanylyltransferase [Desulfocicer vacuolatum]SMC82535.1 adenosylcobinamide kinase /adenosylcobinamide-phosphate guanylyltransferase [Desulfocicer vacuolatum DSM 3385]
MKFKNSLILGGCRSGKSSHALALANQVSGNRKIFMATSVPTDGEMQERVDKHIKERGASWQTAEVPVDIPEKIERLAPDVDVILVDCLTLWVSNLLFNGFDTQGIMDKTRLLTTVLQKSACPVIMVSNEVGSGIVPENALARKFRDMAGFVNQRVAAASDRVILVVAGIPMEIKS